MQFIINARDERKKKQSIDDDDDETPCRKRGKKKRRILIENRPSIVMEKHAMLWKLKDSLLLPVLFASPFGQGS